MKRMIYTLALAVLALAAASLVVTGSSSGFTDLATLVTALVALVGVLSSGLSE